MQHAFGLCRSPAIDQYSDYTYSKALKGTDFVWNDETLDKWLTNPQAFVPGQKMNFKVAKAEDRADIIAYLKTLK